MAARIATAAFSCNGERHYVAILDDAVTAARFRNGFSDPLETTLVPYSSRGCDIEELSASPSGRWIVSRRNSGQSEWGYDLLESNPLNWVAGVECEYGFMLEVPVFGRDESCVIGAAGEGFLGNWWCHPNDNPEQPARGGIVSIGFIFVHVLSNHHVTRHPLLVDLPEGWLPDDLDDPDAWWGPQQLSATDRGIRMLPSWNIPFEIGWPLPPRILLPTPHPSGIGLL